jgi:hypothetical protein
MKYSAKKLEVSAGIVREQETHIARRPKSVSQAMPSRSPAGKVQAPAHPATEPDIGPVATS